MTPSIETPGVVGRPDIACPITKAPLPKAPFDPCDAFKWRGRLYAYCDNCRAFHAFQNWIRA